MCGFRGFCQANGGGREKDYNTVSAQLSEPGHIELSHRLGTTGNFFVIALECYEPITTTVYANIFVYKNCREIRELGIATAN
jgi:hypothetical protein